MRTRILEAALQVFAETGYRGATTRRIAQIADVNEVTLFRHFGSKEDLIRTAVHYAAALQDHPALPDDPVDPVRELTGWAAQQHTRMRGRAAIIRTCMSEQVEHPEMAECMCDGPQRMAAELHAYFERLQQRGLLRADADGETAVMMLMSGLFTDAISRDLMPGLHAYPENEVPARIVGLVWRAVGKAGKGSSRGKSI